jgi:hypothetical protein
VASDFVFFSQAYLKLDNPEKAMLWVEGALNSQVGLTMQV